jgi:hypothetical protein
MGNVAPCNGSGERAQRRRVWRRRGFESVILRPPRGYVEPDPKTFRAIAAVLEEMEKAIPGSNHLNGSLPVFDGIPQPDSWANSPASLGPQCFGELFCWNSEPAACGVVEFRRLVQRNSAIGYSNLPPPVVSGRVQRRPQLLASGNVAGKVMPSTRPESRNLPARRLIRASAILREARIAPGYMGVYRSSSDEW